MKTLVAFFISLGITSPSIVGASSTASTHDVIVVGAGMAGLSAAVEAGRKGADVLVIDMSSVFGGHAVMSGADVAMVDTPLQRARGLHDSPDLAFRDFVRWGKDVNEPWVRYYVDHSREEIYDWLTAMGVVFDGVHAYPGNTVPRAHTTKGLGLGLVIPVYLECLRMPNVEFLWNLQVTDLISEKSAVRGVRVKNLRTGESQELRAGAVILATGGFQSNLDFVRKHWPADLPVPARLLAGSGVNSMGFGLDLAAGAGASLFDLDHQWNYERGLPDPRYPSESRGLNANNDNSMWVNAQGLRFVDEHSPSHLKLNALLHQQPATYWAIFDEPGKAHFWVVGTDWSRRETIERLILNNPQLVKRAASLPALAAQAGLPVDALEHSVDRYNRMIAARDDVDFHRFGASAASADDKNSLPPPIGTPPFYAVQFFPMTRKSMGGVRTDLSSHALDKSGHPVAGLFAAGEAAGLGGINGRAALEGTFLGPSVLTGRVAARTAVSEFGIARTQTAAAAASPSRAAQTEALSSKSCAQCHRLESLVETSRSGYWHFQQAHRIVLERQYECTLCHSGMGSPTEPTTHRINRLAQAQVCGRCHGGED